MKQWVAIDPSSKSSSVATKAAPWPTHRLERPAVRCRERVAGPEPAYGQRAVEELESERLVGLLRSADGQALEPC